MSRLLYKRDVQPQLGHTEIGYTLESLDKVWTAFIFDEEGERLYFDSNPKVMMYDRDCGEGAICWDSYRSLKAEIGELMLRVPDLQVYVINLGDDSRAEDRWLSKRVGLLRGKFVASSPALAELAKLRMAR